METELKTVLKVGVLEKVQEVRVPPGELGAVLELIVRNKNGEITQRQEMLSESFVKQFLQLLWLHMAYRYGAHRVHPKLVKATDGTDYYLQSSPTNWRCDAAANIDYYGIQVGTGATAPTINDYTMETLISHGVGAGQMQYSAVTFGAPTSDGTTSHFTVTRDFSNASGGSITVREVGLVCRISDYKGSTYNFLTIRDAVNITVPDGETLTVNYRIQATA
jgi:hypothetical protein